MDRLKIPIILIVVSVLVYWFAMHGTYYPVLIFIILSGIIYWVYRQEMNITNKKKSDDIITLINEDPLYKLRFLKDLEYVIYSKKTNTFVNFENYFNTVLASAETVGKFSIKLHIMIDVNNYLFVVLNNGSDFVNWGFMGTSDIEKVNQMFFVLRKDLKSTQYEVCSSYYKDLEEKNIHNDFAIAILDLLNHQSDIS